MSLISKYKNFKLFFFLSKTINNKNSYFMPERLEQIQLRLL